MVEKCTNCGNCRTVCPVFKITGEEIYSTRGRINLVKGFLNNELAPGPDFRDKIFVCLNCRQCVDLCPADVEYYEIMKNTKAKISSVNKLFNLKQSFYKGVFSDTAHISESYFSLFRLSRKLFYKNNELNFFGKIIFPILKIDNSVKLPDIAVKNFFKMKIRHELKNYKGFRIALFLGCGGKYLYPEAADNFVKILRSNGIEVLIPKDQVCCGNPLDYKGLIKDASRNQIKNTSSFNSLLDIKLMVSLCCNADITFTEFHSYVPKEKLRLPVKDFIEFIEEYGVEVTPAFENSIIFHSCPKCKKSEIYKKFIGRLYEDYTRIPEFTTDFCGSTELLDKSNMEFRNIITRSFCENNNLKNYDFIACSSFECIEHLNGYFLHNKMSIKAIHFADALKK